MPPNQEELDVIVGAIDEKGPSYVLCEYPRLNCHLGKTHSHRSRGDTTRKAQGAAHTHTNSHAPHTITDTGSDRQKGRGGRGHGGFPIRFGGVSYTIRILMYLDVSRCILRCILMCPVHIHQDTPRYIKIHLYLSLWLSWKCILPWGIYDTFRIHLGYNVS